MRTILFAVFILCHVLVRAPELNAQIMQEKDVSWELGANVGTALPNQIEGVSEIFPQAGLGVAFPINAEGTGFWEASVNSGRGDGIIWSQATLNLRMGVPIDTLMGIAFAGIDAVQYEAPGVERTAYGGGHVGGGVMSQLAGGIWARTDMRMVFNPGVTMQIYFGLVIRVPSSGGGSGG